ncbi:unnamed protein product, partial [Adineta steineri]
MITSATTTMVTLTITKKVTSTISIPPER